MPVPKELKTYDLHFVFNGGAEVLKCFDNSGKVRWQVPCRNRAIGGNGYGHHAKCPPGDFFFGTPGNVNPPRKEFGRWFIPVEDMDGHMEKYGRIGIGAHGGGSAAPDPFAPKQVFCKTLGCFRLYNEDLEKKLVPAVKFCKSHGGVPYLTVVQPS